MFNKLNINNNSVSVYLGDCLDVMLDIQEHSVDLIVCDPPYGATQNTWDVVIPFVPLWKCIKRVLKPKGIVVFTASQPFASRLIMSNLSWYKYDLIWQKTIGSGQLNIRKRPLRLHEHILVFYDEFGTYNEQRTEGTPYSIVRKANVFKGSYGKQRTHKKKNDGFRHAKSIIKIPNPRIKDGHKAEKPVSLMEYLIKCYSNKGDTVLDFVMGRCTTGIACINLDRNFVGIEKEKEWYNKSIQRLKEKK